MLSEFVLVSPSITAYALCCVFMAAIARGFSGFGFTLLAITSLSFVLPLSTVVPAMFVLEIAAGLKLIPSIWGQVHWGSIRVLVITSIITTPLGAYLLVKIPGEYVKVVLAVLIIACCLTLITGFKLQKMPSFMQTA
ncbi:sulfite exporter TauE/SafE family protein, partial [Pseudomonas sp. CM25]